MPQLRKLHGLQLSLLAVAMLPWSMVLQETNMAKALAPLHDGMKLELAIGKDCEHPFKTFTATVARSNAARARGLSKRIQPLASNEAMLFVFAPPEKVTFWMRDTLIPLDLALFKENGNLYDIRHMAVEPDPKDPKKLYNSSSEVLFALETPYNSLESIEKDPGILCVNSDRFLPRKKTAPTPTPTDSL